MIYGVYTIFDEAANRCGPVYVSVTDRVAIRSYYQAMEAVPPQYQADYQLVCLGSYDDEALTIVPCATRIVDCVVPSRSDPTYDTDPQRGA